MAGGCVRVIMLRDLVKQKVNFLMGNVILGKKLTGFFLQLEINNIANCEFTIFIVRVNASGRIILTFIIFKTDLIENFIDNKLNNSVKFVRLPTGFSSVEFTLDWLKYFNYYSFYISPTFTKLRKENSYKLYDEGFIFEE